MNAWHAWIEGMRRVYRAPALVGGLWLVIALVSAPIAISEYTFHENYPGQRTALVVSGRPVAQLQSVLRAVEEIFSGAMSVGESLTAIVRHPLDFLQYQSKWMVAIETGYPFGIVWLFVSGGIVDRFARNRPTGAYGFFGASGVFFLRFLRLAVLVAMVDVVAYLYLRQLPFVSLAVLAGWNLVLEYAQVRAVVEDRRSMIGALRAAVAFLRRNLGAAVALSLANYALLAGLIALFAVVGPASQWISWTLGPFIVVQLGFVLIFLWVKLLFLATETALFQGRLAHAGYVAKPLPVWPDSPSAEAIRRM